VIYTHQMEAQPNTKDVVFAARLTPYRSLGPQGFKILMVAIGSACLIIGLVFSIAGVWPVLGFMGLDFLLIYGAFKLNFRDARAYEDVEVSRDSVFLRKVSPKGRRKDHHFPQFGTRFETARHDEIGITRMWIANRQREVEMGTFLNPVDRESFADAFSLALSKAKR